MVYTYTYILHIHAYIPICIYIYMRCLPFFTYMYVYVYIYLWYIRTYISYIYMHTYPYLYTYIWDVCPFSPKCMYIYIYTYDIYIHIYIYTHDIYIYLCPTHTCIHTPIYMFIYSICVYEFIVCIYAAASFSVRVQCADMRWFPSSPVQTHMYSIHIYYCIYTHINLLYIYLYTYIYTLHIDTYIIYWYMAECVTNSPPIVRNSLILRSNFPY